MDKDGVFPRALKPGYAQKDLVSVTLFNLVGRQMCHNSNLASRDEILILITLHISVRF